MIAEFACAGCMLADEVRERFPGIDVRMTGLVIFDQIFMEVSLADLKALVPASYAAMALMLVLLTGGFAGTFAIMLVVARSRRQDFSAHRPIV